MEKKDIKKIVLAYSGGLNTSIILPLLSENYNNPALTTLPHNPRRSHSPPCREVHA